MVDYCLHYHSKKGYFTVTLSGGNTPLKLFRNLRENLKNDFWENTRIFMVDERFVPENHPDSNQKMIRENLLRQGFNDHPYFYPVPIKEDVKKSAQAYQDILINFFHAVIFNLFCLVYLERKIKQRK